MKKKEPHDKKIRLRLSESQRNQIDLMSEEQGKPPGRIGRELIGKALRAIQQKKQIEERIFSER